MFIYIGAMLDKLGTKEICCHGCCSVIPETWHTRNDIQRQVVSVQLVEHGHVEWCRGRPLFLVTAHVHVVVVCAAIRETMDQQRIAVKCKYYRSVPGEHRVEFVIRQAVRMLAVGLERHQVHDVDDTHAQVGYVSP